MLRASWGCKSILSILSPSVSLNSLTPLSSVLRTWLRCLASARCSMWPCCALWFTFSAKSFQNLVRVTFKSCFSVHFLRSYGVFPYNSCFLVLCLDVDINHSGPTMHLAAWINVDWFIMTIIIAVWSVWRYWNSRMEMLNVLMLYIFCCQLQQLFHHIAILSCLLSLF